MTSTIRPTRRAALLGGLACVVAGCVREPTVKLHSARITGVERGGVDFEMRLSIRNDNSFDVLLRDLRADFLMGRGYRVPTVQISPNIWLPSDQTGLVRVPVVVPWQIIKPLIQETLGSATIPYRATGFANVTATRALEIDVDEYRIDQDGAFSRAELVTAALRGLGASQIG
jgi:LEA14-like dessication related protein